MPTASLLRLSLLENGFGNLDLWAVESFGNVVEILTAQGVRTLLSQFSRLLSAL
jgi:hypothetical protein